ncbi:MAG TPA: DUF4232 domain-containing protein [Mycobacteriales bacterium]|nr:DUF4232 domain-containing protein [Mycobacteriales bacterium]
MNTRILLAAVAVLAAAGCSGGSSNGGTPSGGTPTGVPSVSTSASTTPSASATPSPSPSLTPTFPTTIKATQTCATGSLSLSVGQGQGAAGTSYVSLVFTNTGSKPCTLYGYPGVSFLDAAGKQLGVPATHTGGAEGVVTLAPHGTANAQLGLPDTGNFSASGCQQATSSKLQVYPPGDYGALTISYAAAICTTAAGATSVTPVTPGSGA